MVTRFGISLQSREDNPLHTVAFNELIENLKKKIQHGETLCLIVNAQCLGHSLWMRIVIIEVTKITLKFNTIWSNMNENSDRNH